MKSGFLSRSAVAGALAAATAFAAGCGVGEIGEPASGAGAGQSGQVDEQTPVEPRLVTRVIDGNGTRYSFYQNVDASMELLEQGKQGRPMIELPEGELDVLGVYRAIAPGKPLPEALLQADRHFQHAKANGLLGTAWLPAERSGAAAPPADQPVETVALAATVGEPAIDGEWFRETFCDPLESDSQTRCYIDVTGNWQFSQSRIAHRALTLGMSTGAGSIEITYQSCAIGIFCKNRITGLVQQGDYSRWKSGGHKSSFTYKVGAAGVIWHFANTIQSIGP